MKPEQAAPVLQSGFHDRSLRALIGRLKALALRPAFRRQREIALGRALQPYMENAQPIGLTPLAEELDLAELYVSTDYFPDDGQLSLIEQVRDTIEVHVPDEERQWLDPLKHSAMDLLEVRTITQDGGEGSLTLRSMGDGRTFQLAVGGFSQRVTAGQGLLTRLIPLPAQPEAITWPGTAIVLAPSIARRIVESCRECQREMEAESGSFNLGDWREYTKRYGYVLLWMFAQARLDALLAAERSIVYRTPDGQPFLYAIALYEHDACRHVVDGLNELEGIGVSSEPLEHAKEWVQRNKAGDIISRITVTPFQLFLECDSEDRLNGLKHQLASVFGFALHFRGETTAVPRHHVPEVNLEAETPTPPVVIVSRDEEHRLVSSFLETVYLEWPDRPSAALEGRTPRHAAAQSALRDRVAAIIDQIERDDVGVRQTGKRGYDYNTLRAHIGLGEG